MTINSRNKGATFERKVAQELDLRLGIRFRRNLEQAQTAGLGDLLADDPAFPFSIECKHSNPANARPLAWRAQASESAQKAGLMPAVIWRLTGGPIRVSVPLSAFQGPADEWFDMTLDGFAWLCREVMADQSAWAVADA